MGNIILTEKILLNKSDDDYIYYIMLKNEHVGHIRCFNTIIKTFLYIDIFIEEEFRNLGYGSEALKLLYEKLAISKVEQIYIKCIEKDKNKFLEKNEFIPNNEYLYGTLYCKQIV